MIDRETGDIVLRDGTRLGRVLTRDAFVWTSPLHSKARRGEGATGWTSWYLEAELSAGERATLCLRFLHDRLDRIELTFPWDGPPFFADPAWKASQDRWIENALGAAPPLSFDWGRVESVADDRGGSCSILIKY